MNLPPLKDGDRILITSENMEMLVSLWIATTLMHIVETKKKGE